MLSCKFGNNYITEISGGSHEPEMIVKISGIPAGFIIHMDILQNFLNRRAPGKNKLGTTRKETDQPLLITENGYKSIHILNTSLQREAVFAIKNKNYNSSEYNLEIPRPGHADLPAHLKYGNTVNMSGGGPFSGRMTAMLCISGGIALQILNTLDIEVGTRPLQIGMIYGEHQNPISPKAASLSKAMKEEIEYARKDNDSVGGSIEFYVTGLPAGLGGPMQDGCESLLSSVLFGIPAVKAVEFGSGCKSSQMRGSQCNDSIVGINHDNTIETESNNHGGILGGITTGMPLTGQVFFKPTPSIGRTQKSIKISTGEITEFSINGRHDPCIIPRALPVVEAAVAISILDLIIEHRPDLLDKYNQEDDLNKYRMEINEIDTQLQDLLDKRMKVAEKVAHYKLKNNMEIFHPEREKAVLDRVTPAYRTIYQEIMNVSKEIQKDLMK